MPIRLSQRAGADRGLAGISNSKTAAKIPMMTPAESRVPGRWEPRRDQKAAASGAVSGRATVPSSGTGHVICGAPALDYPRPKCELASFVV